MIGHTSHIVLTIGLLLPASLNNSKRHRFLKTQQPLPAHSSPRRVGDLFAGGPIPIAQLAPQ